MSSANCYPGIDARIVASVRHHARRASRRLSGMELEDIEQECILHVHRRLPSHEPSRADLWTYADRILTSFTANLLEAAGAMSRGGGVPPLSLNDPGVDKITSPVLSERERAPVWCEQIDLRQDLDRTRHSLPRHLQDCCSWLTEGSVAEAAQRSGLARGSIYSRMATLKRAFAAAGLDAYLDAPARHF